MSTSPFLVKRTAISPSAAIISSYSRTVSGHWRQLSTACTSARSSFTMVPLNLAMENSEEHCERSAEIAAQHTPMAPTTWLQYASLSKTVGTAFALETFATRGLSPSTSVNEALADLACELWTPQYVSY